MATVNMINGSPQKAGSSKQIKIEQIQSKDVPTTIVDDEESKEESFDWEKYMAKNNSAAVPKSTFKHLIAGSSFDFESGMKLEVPNQDSSNTYWLATVIAKSGPLILLRYEGYQDDNSADFWCNSQSSEIHPVGWCAKTKHALRPPKAIQHKEKSWYDYLIKNLTGARKAAEHLFKQRVKPIDKLVVGMMLEVIDKEDPKFYWVAIISEIYAGRLRLQYKGTEDATGEIWCYYLSERLFEPGHGYVYGLALRPPRDVLKTISEKQWPDPKLERKLMTCWEKTLLSALLKERPPPVEHSFKTGMKLEAKDPMDPTCICCATVARVFDRFHFLVRIDNLLSSSVHEDRSFICHKKSHGIYPVGWCHKFGLSLHPPKGFNGHFTWKAYLQLEKAIAAPEELFDLEPVEHEFKVGMKLEAVDQENTVNICVATVTQVLGRDVWVTFDGESRSEQLFDVRSHDLFPVGWCEMSGHELQWPRPSTILQKNRISRLRSTTERKTRLDHLRKGGPRAKKSIQSGHNSNQNSDDERELKSRNRKRKLMKAKYYKGSKKRIKQKAVQSTSGDEDGGYVDPTISYVFIRGLAEELNTEKEIKTGFKLTEDGSVPRKVITIDSDDEEEPEAKQPVLSESEMHFFTTLKVKPNDLNSTQREEFDLLSGMKLPLAERRKNSLSAIGEKHRGSQSSSVAARLRLIDFYRRQKTKQRGRLRYSVRRAVAASLQEQNASNERGTNTGKNTGTNTGTQAEELNKENLKSGDSTKLHRSLRRGERRTNFRVLHLTGQKAVTTSTESGSSANGTRENAEAQTSARNYGVTNGVYRVVENKSQSNKIVMKIAKPNNLKDTKVNGTTDHSLLLDGYSPARDLPAIEEHMTTKCNQIRSSCNGLPKNPLTWTKHHVVEFIQAADLTKYARIFIEEEIDGHAFLLLTLNELHNLMGMSVGPAAKLTDYIYTLQRDATRLTKSSPVAQDSIKIDEDEQSDDSKTHENTPKLKSDANKSIDKSNSSTAKSTSSTKSSSSATKTLSSSARSSPSSSKDSRSSSPETSVAPLITKVYSISKPLFSKLQQS